MVVVMICMITGCNIFGDKKTEPVVIEHRTATVPVFHPPLPEGVTLVDVQWQVWTPKRMQQYIKDLNEGKEVPAALFSLTEQGYQNLTNDVAELKRLIKEYRSIIVYYRQNVNQMAVEPQTTQTSKKDNK